MIKIKRFVAFLLILSLSGVASSETLTVSGVAPVEKYAQSIHRLSNAWERGGLADKLDGVIFESLPNNLILEVHKYISGSNKPFSTNIEDKEIHAMVSALKDIRTARGVAIDYLLTVSDAQSLYSQYRDKFLQVEGAYDLAYSNYVEHLVYSAIYSDAIYKLFLDLDTKLNSGQNLLVERFPENRATLEKGMAKEKVIRTRMEEIKRLGFKVASNLPGHLHHYAATNKFKASNQSTAIDLSLKLKEAVAAYFDDGVLPNIR